MHCMDGIVGFTACIELGMSSYAWGGCHSVKLSARCGSCWLLLFLSGVGGEFGVTRSKGHLYFLSWQVGGLSIIAAGSYVEENTEVPSGEVSCSKFELAVRTGQP